VPGFHCEIAESYRARWWWRSPPALGLVSLPLQLDELRQSDDQPSEFLGFVIGQLPVREGDGIGRLSVHMGQRQAIGIDDPIAARDRLKSPWAREAALRHPTSISGAGGGGLSGDVATSNTAMNGMVRCDTGSLPSWTRCLKAKIRDGLSAGTSGRGRHRQGECLPDGPTPSTVPRCDLRRRFQFNRMLRRAAFIRG
jgi:hypothetical protein